MPYNQTKPNQTEPNEHIQETFDILEISNVKLFII